MQIQTLAHHLKMVMVHRQVIDFEPVTLQVGTVRETPTTPTALGPTKAEVSDDSALIPKWLKQEMRQVAEIEPALFPNPELLGRFVRYVPPALPEPGEVYASCWRDMTAGSPDIVFLVPWLIPGGADQGVLHHVNAALAAGRRVAVITTIDRESPWRERLPREVCFLELGVRGRRLTEPQRLDVLTRLILQSTASVIHLINSPLGWEMLRQHGRSVRAVGKRVYASVFCDDYDFYGARRSYPQMYLEDCWPWLDGLFCDTQWYPHELQHQYGVSLEKIRTLYFPVKEHVSPVYRSQDLGRVLWTGRFAQQKRLDLLIAIAKLMPEVQFEIHGYAVLPHEKEMAAAMRRVANIEVRGAFESLNDLVASGDYAVLLFTSGWEGLPLTLLDATMAGLPIVASAVGGVGEFINDTTGYLVTAVEDPAAYVAQLSAALADGGERRRRWEAAVSLAHTRHGFDHFYETVRAVPGYLMLQGDQP